MEHFAWTQTFSMFPEESVTCESQVSHFRDTSVCELKTHVCELNPSVGFFAAEFFVALLGPAPGQL